MADTPKMPVLALLAGGRATRMNPATLAVAKSMLPLAGEPMLGHQLRMAREQGIRRVVLCCGHLEEQLRQYAGDGSAWDLSVSYASDGATPLGTGGALRAALPLLGERFIVMYGDSLLPAVLGPAWQSFLASGCQGSMTVFRNAGLWDVSNVWFEAGQIAAYSKSERLPEMQHIDYGLNCFAAAAFEPWPEGSCFDLAAVHAGLLARGELAGFEVAERFYEIGSPEGYAEAERYLQAAGQRRTA